MRRWKLPRKAKKKYIKTYSRDRYKLCIDLHIVKLLLGEYSPKCKFN